MGLLKSVLNEYFDAFILFYHNTVAIWKKETIFLEFVTPADLVNKDWTKSSLSGALCK